MPVPASPSLICLLAVALLAGAGTAQAQAREEGGGRRGESGRQAWPDSGRDAMTDSIRRVRSAAGGQVLSAERMHMDGRQINRIKMVDERGRVRVYEDDPSRRRDVRPRTRGRDE